MALFEQTELPKDFYNQIDSNRENFVDLVVQLCAVKELKIESLDYLKILSSDEKIDLLASSRGSYLIQEFWSGEDEDILIGKEIFLRESTKVRVGISFFIISELDGVNHIFCEENGVVTSHDIDIALLSECPLIMMTIFGAIFVVHSPGCLEVLTEGDSGWD